MQSFIRSFAHSLIHLFIKCVLNTYCVPDNAPTVVGTGNTVENKTDKTPAFVNLVV